MERPRGHQEISPCPSDVCGGGVLGPKRVRRGHSTLLLAGARRRFERGSNIPYPHRRVGSPRGDDSAVGAVVERVNRARVAV